MYLICKYVHLDLHAMHHVFVILICCLNLEIFPPKCSYLSGIITKTSQLHVLSVQCRMRCFDRDVNYCTDRGIGSVVYSGADVEVQVEGDEEIELKVECEVDYESVSSANKYVKDEVGVNINNSVD